MRKLLLACCLLTVMILASIQYLIYNKKKYSESILLANGLFTNDQYLIDTNVCRVKAWPLFDNETFPLYFNMTSNSLICFFEPLADVRRVNFTWIQIYLSALEEKLWKCYARELKRSKYGDNLLLGPFIGPIGLLTNFANNLTDVDVNGDGVQLWNSVEIMCNKSKKENFTHVVPLVQYYRNKVNVTKPKINVMLLGIDSVSRMNFLRHFILTKKLIEDNGFIPMLGYHKIGDNSFPNVFAMLTGYKGEDFYNETLEKIFGRNQVEFDNFTMIFKEFDKRGYLTTLLEDMPNFGFFSYGKTGFKKQPTTYYLRPTNLAIQPNLYYFKYCYKNQSEQKVFLLQKFCLPDFDV